MIRIVRDLTPSDPALGIALEEALLETAKIDGVDTLRLWVNDRAVVIGRSQTAADEVDLNETERLRIPVIRRISGGGAVYHYPGNLNISLYLSDGRRLGGVAEAFRRMGGSISAGLRKLGIEAEPIGNNLLLNGNKVSGAAQARRGRALLYHTTLLVHPDSIPMERLLRALRPGYHTSSVSSHPYPTAVIRETIRQELSLEELAHEIEVGIVASLGQTAVESEISEKEMGKAQELVQEKYGADRWNLQH